MTTVQKFTVSVVIPTYNCGQYMRQAVDSALSQASAHLQSEVVVVDDGSTDNTEQVARGYGRSIKYFRIPHCGFPGVVRNHGLQRAQGEFVAFLDADDFLLPDSFETRLRLLREDPSLGFVFGNFYTLEGTRRTLWYKNTEPQSGGIFEELFQSGSIAIRTNTILVRRSLVMDAGGFSAHVREYEDYWLWLQLAKRARSTYVSEPVSVYRQRPGSLSTAPLIEKLPDLIHVLELISKESKLPHSMIVERINPLRIWLAKEHLREGRYWGAANWLALAFLSQPKEIVKVLHRHLRRAGGN